MDNQKISTLVIEHCLCDGCKEKINKLRQIIPQVHSIELDTEQGKATIFGAVDPATVMEELARKGITPKILWETSSPINNHHQQNKIALPEPSLRGQVSSPFSSRSIRRQDHLDPLASSQSIRRQANSKQIHLDPSPPSQSIRRQAHRKQDHLDPSPPSQSIRTQVHRKQNHLDPSPPSQSIRTQAHSKQIHLDPSPPSQSIRTQVHRKQDHLDPSPPSQSIRTQAHRKQDHLDPSPPSQSIRTQVHRKQDHLDPSPPSQSIRTQAHRKQDHLDPSPPSQSIRTQVHRKQNHLNPSPPSQSIRRQAHRKQDHLDPSPPSQSIRTQAHRKQDHLDPLPPSQSIRRQAHREQVHPDRPLRSQSIRQKNFADCYLNHEHELKEVKCFNKRFTCDGCKEDGFKSRYRCERCNYDLHYECRFPKLAISPEINEELVFEFRPQPPTEKLCDACGKGIHGYFYNCPAEGMDLHPCCARLKAQVRNHDMILFLRKKVSSECLWCREKVPPGIERGIPGWCYVSECKKYNIHILCITQMLHQAWQRGLMDRTGESSIRNIHFEQMAVSDRNRGGRGTVALKIVGILRIVIGILLGDPSVFFGKLMFEFLEQLL